MNFELGAKSVTLPAGAYIVGDPCYHVPKAQWTDVLNESNFFDQCWASFKTHDGHDGIVVAFNTKHGDGVFTDGAGREYGVDAGLIGIIPVLDIDPDMFDDQLAHAIRFTSPVRCFERDGVITFGHVDINTDVQDEDEEEQDRDFSDSEFDGDDGFFTGVGE